MSDQDHRETRIIGRDADAAADDALTDQLNQTTSESAGGNVSGTGDADRGPDLDIVFEREDVEDARH